MTIKPIKPISNSNSIYRTGYYGTQDKADTVTLTSIAKGPAVLNNINFNNK